MTRDENKFFCLTCFDFLLDNADDSDLDRLSHYLSHMCMQTNYIDYFYSKFKNIKEN